jgi:hypothetical protein
LQRVFGEIIIPPSVHREIIALQQFDVSLRNYENSDWIKVMMPTDKAKVQELMLELDAGESEAITLAKEINANFLLIDERLGTNKALEEGLQTIGLIGVLMKAKSLHIIDSVKPILVELKEEAGFWLGKKLMNVVLKEVGEL